MNEAPSHVRIDQWIWSVRVVRTRSAATAACRAGHVRIGGERAKAAAPVRLGDEVRVRMHGFDRVLIVRELLTKRVGAAQAAGAFEDRSPRRPDPVDAQMVPRRDAGSGRPTRRQRREIDRLRGR